MLEPKPWQKWPHLRTLEIFIGDFRLISREMFRSKKWMLMGFSGILIYFNGIDREFNGMLVLF